MKSIFWKTALVLISLGAIQANAQVQRKVTIQYEQKIECPDIENFTDAPIIFGNSLYPPTSQTEDIGIYKEERAITYEDEAVSTTRNLGDTGVWYTGVVPNGGAYQNAFNSTTTNHYYPFSITDPTKITARTWNIPTTSNFDIALYKWSTNTNSYNRVSLSQEFSATEEQLSYIADSGDYVYEVALTGTLDTSIYYFSASSAESVGRQR